MIGRFVAFSVFGFLVSGLDIAKECEVVNTFEVDPVEYDSVSFHAYVDESDNVFKAELKCSKGEPDFLILTSNHSLTLDSIVDNMGYGRKEISERHPLDFGWHDFNLHLEGQYALDADQRLSWKSIDGKGLKCPVPRVTISDGTLMRRCPEGMPTWIGGNGAIDIPLAAGEFQGEGQKLVFFSRKSFMPKIEVEKGKLLTVGFDNGSLKISEEEGELEHLPPFRQHGLSIRIAKDHYKDRLKVGFSHAHEELYSTFVKDKPKSLRVVGSTFKVIQDLKRNVPLARGGEIFGNESEFPTRSTPTEGPGLFVVTRRLRNPDVSSPDVMTIALVSGLVICLGIILALSVMVGKSYRNKKNTATTGCDTGENVRLGGNELDALPLKDNKRQCESLYLRPLSHIPPQFPPPPRTVCVRQMSQKTLEAKTSFSEHQDPIYETPADIDPLYD